MKRVDGINIEDHSDLDVSEILVIPLKVFSKMSLQIQGKLNKPVFDNTE